MNPEDAEARALALQILLDWLTDLFREQLLALPQPLHADALAHVPEGLRLRRSEFLEDLLVRSVSDAELRRWLLPFDAALAHLQEQLLAPPDQDELRKADIARVEAQPRREPPTTPD